MWLTLRVTLSNWVGSMSHAWCVTQRIPLRFSSSKDLYSHEWHIKSWPTSTREPQIHRRKGSFDLKKSHFDYINIENHTSQFNYLRGVEVNFFKKLSSKSATSESQIFGGTKSKYLIHSSKPFARSVLFIFSKILGKSYG